MMLVYGDLEIIEKSEVVLDALYSQLTQMERKVGLARHEVMSEFLISSGAFAQFLLDHGVDEELETILNSLLLEAASLFIASLKHEREFNTRDAIRLLDLLDLKRLHPEIRMKVPEGFAFYSLFPEMIVQVGEDIRKKHPDREWVVIGIRSIGTVLAPLLSVVLGAQAMTTVRPVGDPFRRELHVNPSFEKRFLIAGAHYAIIDEGPGLSGSSFASVAQWLFERYVLPDHVHFFPSHPNGPGPFTTPENQRIWDTVHSHYVDFDHLRTQSIPCWPLRHLKNATDISGGKWRTIHAGMSGKLPPTHPFQERRKYWIPNSREGAVSKFVGLGRVAGLKKKIALSLSSDQWIPKVNRFEYGWVNQEWHSWPSLFHSERSHQLEALPTVAEYLSYRNREFQVTDEIRGASASELLTMMERNLTLAFGEERVRPVLSRMKAQLPSLVRESKPIFTDGRLHLWEWLRKEDGTLLKCDAFDHSLAHDLIGPQDIAWDIAGASVEFNLSQNEHDLLVRALSSEGIQRSEEWICFMKLAYLSFQMGYYSLASQSLAQTDVQESKRLHLRSVWLQSVIETDFLNKPIQI